MLKSLQSGPTPWTVTHQASLSMGFSRQEYWSRLPFPSPGDLPDPGIEPSMSPAALALADRFFTTSAAWDPTMKVKVRSLSRVRLFATPPYVVTTQPHACRRALCSHAT